MNIITNNVPRNLLYIEEVPKKILEDEFEWIREQDIVGGFFKFKGRYYHLQQFLRISSNPETKGWDGYNSDSFFSGLLIKLVEDEQVIVGTYFS